MTPADHDPEWATLLHGFVDDELDAANALKCEQHVAQCQACADELAGLLALRQRFRRDGVAWPVPTGLRDRVTAAIDIEARQRRQGLAARMAAYLHGLIAAPARWSLLPSLGVLAVALALFVARPLQNPAVEDDLVAGHVRSLLADHLTDVATSSQHVVKPWFNGRIDFSPPVIDLTDRGFPLVGGRVDYLGGRVVAALVYRRNGHVINLFVRPGSDGEPATEQREGYNLVHWNDGGLSFSAVSDANAEDLARFEMDFRRSAPAAEQH